MKLVSAVREEVATICGFTDAQLLRATLCAESKGEPLQGQQGVLVREPHRQRGHPGREAQKGRDHEAPARSASAWRHGCTL